MNRSDYACAPLSLEQYEAIIAAGEVFTDGAGNKIVSPLHGSLNWAAMAAECTQGNFDPRGVLAALLFEDHFGTDPAGGVALAKVYNFGGIKWEGQAGAFDSGIPVPPDEQPGTYAGFYSVGNFVHELIRTLNNQYIGPAFASGDLTRAWAIYIGGPNNPNMAGGQARVDQWRYYQKHYPAQGATPVTDGVYGEDLIAKFETQIGHAYSGDYDQHNGNHPWAYWCRAGVESTGRNCGLDVVAHTSALTAQQAAASQGLLVTDGTPPEHGAIIQLDARFYSPDGHTGIWNADKGMMLCTVTDGSGVGYKAWGPGTVGYAGWYRLPGIVDARRTVTPAPPMDSGNLVIPGTPGNDKRPVNDRIGVGGAMRRVWELLPEPFVALGFPLTNEYDAIVTDEDGSSKQRTVQEFQRAVLVYQPELAMPWDVVWALRTQKITKKPT